MTAPEQAATPLCNAYFGNHSYLQGEKEFAQSLERQLATLTTQRDALRAALVYLRRSHHSCEDDWYSCPKSEDGCANDSEGDECNCGADKYNAKIDAALASGGK